MTPTALWVVSELITKVKDFSEQSLNDLLSNPNLGAQISEGGYEYKTTNINSRAKSNQNRRAESLNGFFV